MRHLRYEYPTAWDHKVDGHAQTVMKQLGITYQHSTPQSMGDQFWFWNCENVPENLPEYISELDVDPMECIGWGLSKEQAKMIAQYKSLS